MAKEGSETCDPYWITSRVVRLNPTRRSGRAVEPSAAAEAPGRVPSRTDSALVEGGMEVAKRKTLGPGRHPHFVGFERYGRVNGRVMKWSRRAAMLASE
jgi:hypothetical protein